jgi:enamine deaminase RidA (YjgF/YER057c/UK114 family)
MSQFEENIKKLGYTLPESVPPAASYVPYVVTGNLVVISGQLPMKDGKPQFIGTLGKDISLEEGQECARLCAINVLSHLKAACGGNLDKVVRCVRLGVFVTSTPDFTDQPKVANGASDMMLAIFGDKGKHARAAVGMAQLPFGVAVEVEAMFEIAA